MSDDTRQGSRGARRDQDRQGQLAELGLPLEELGRRRARDILQRVIEAEAQMQLDEFAAVSLIDGRRAVVRKGYLPARAILTTVGPVEVQVPKVRRPDFAESTSSPISAAGADSCAERSSRWR